MILSQADGFIYESSPINTALQSASELAKSPQKGPILLLDHSDNVMSGGPCDTTDILEAALQFGLSNIACGPFADPATVEWMKKVRKEIRGSKPRKRSSVEGEAGQGYTSLGA